MFKSVCLVFVTWNGLFVLQRCWKTGVWVGLLGVCDMKWAYGVTKVLEDWCFGSVCLGFVTWNGCLVLQRCWKTGVLVGLPGVCDMEWAFCGTKVLCEWGMRWVLMG